MMQRTRRAIAKCTTCAYGHGLIALLALAACGGEARHVADTATATPDTATKGAPVAGGTGSSGAAQAPTGKTWDVQMVGDEKGYRFEPANLTIKAGDAVRWTLVSGPPHNVTFWADSIPQGAASQLGANMPEVTAPLVGPLRMNPNDTYTVSFAGVPAGAYGYYCTPHLALGMKAVVTVQ